MSNIVFLYHPQPALRREWGIRSPLWGRSHTGGCSKGPSRLPRGGDNRPTTSRMDSDTTGEGNHNYQLSIINYQLFIYEYRNLAQV